MPILIDGIVIHRCETGRTGEEVKAAEGKGGLGYHYFIGPTGIVYQLYPDSDTVWHACKWSKVALGIAVYGDFHPPDNSRNSVPQPEQWASLVSLCRRLTQKYGSLFILGHTDLANSSKDAKKVCPGFNLDVQALSRAVYHRDLVIVQNTS